MEQSKALQDQGTTEGTEQDNRFYKIRNTGKCLSEGVSLLTEHFVRMLYLSLPVSIPYALSSAIIAQLSTHIISGLTTSMLVSILAFSTILFLCSIAMLALVFRFVEVKASNESLKQQTFKSIYNKNFFGLSIKALFYIIITSILAAIACGLVFLYMMIGSKDWDLDKTTLKVIGLVVILLVLLTIAIAYNNVLPTVMLQKGSFVRPYIDGFKRGFKKWGKMMQISVLVALLVGVVSFLLNAPAIVFTFVQRAALTSQLNGDAVNLPDHFEIWMFITLLITSFVSFYIQMLYFTPLSFTYASIKTEEEEADGAIPMV